MNDIEFLKETLKSYIPKRKPILFVCVGTDRSTGDALGPLVGTQLAKKGYNVLGTLDETVTALNLEDTIEKIKREYSDHFVIAVDSSLGRLSSVGSINVVNEPLRPGTGVGKDLPEIGDIRITGVVNVGGFMPYFVLQNTQLSLVMKMADQIVEVCSAVRRKRKVKLSA